MKRKLSITAIALSIMLLASLQNTANAQPRVDVGINYQTFYDELDPYGRWMDYPDYGYVWIPDAGPDFRPYNTNGHWVWSDDYEWMWVSDYDWGWAPFHYGRWLEDPYYGWMWVPGYEWSPAWVAWRDGGDYYGWAPLRPGINISIGFSLGGYDPPIDYWCFAPRRYITSPRIYDYCMPRHNNVTIINQTTIINNYNYNRNVFRTGPGRRDAERYTGRINSVRFRESSSPGRARFGRNNEVSVYRPNVQRDNNQSFSPRKFDRFDRNSGGRNDGNAGRRNGNGNNLPQRREGNGNSNRGFDRGNNDRQNGNGNDRQNGNGGITERRRVTMDRDQSDNNPRSTPERPNRQSEPRARGNNETGETSPIRGRNRDRGDGNTNGNGNGNRERRDVFERNNTPNTPSQPREARPIERRRIETPQTGQNPGDRRMERREIFNRGNDNNPRPERQMRTQESRPQESRPQESRPQRQSAPQMEQRRQEQPQSQSRQSERRNDNGGGGDNGRGNGGGRRGR